LQPDQIFNVDKTSVYWKGLPTKTFALVNKKSALGHTYLKKVRQCCEK
jgi:hypothetical protein